MGEVGNNGSDNVDYATLIARRDDTGNGYYRGGDLDGTEHADFDVNHVTMAAAQGGNAGGYTARGGESLQQVARAIEAGA